MKIVVEYATFDTVTQRYPSGKPEFTKPVKGKVEINEICNTKQQIEDIKKREKEKICKQKNIKYKDLLINLTIKEL